MIVKWPGVTKAGTINRQYLVIEDIFPTFLEIAKLRKEAANSPDGISFIPLLTGKGKYPVDRPVYWHYPNTYDQPPYSAIRKGDWKLIYHHVDRKIELFNLKNDIGEQNDLSKLEKQKTSELARLLTDHLIETKARMPTDKKMEETVGYPISRIQ